MTRDPIDVRAEVLEAEPRIREHIRQTPLQPSPWLSELGRCRVYLKLECLQLTGSFKLRGAANKLLSLEPEERERGVVTASTGNHGGAVAYLLHRFGWPGTVYVPRGAAEAKLRFLRQHHAQIRFEGEDCVETETLARQRAEEEGRVFVSPYNDARVVGGQGTIGLELERQTEELDHVLVPVGGGGLVSGVAGYLKSLRPKLEVVGCQPRASAVMWESVKAGRLVEAESLPTLSDGTAGGIEAGSVTFPICQRHVDRFELVSEEAIATALRGVIENHHTLVEGAGALPVAAFLEEPTRYEGRTVVLVLSGAKIGLETLRRVLG